MPYAVSTQPTVLPAPVPRPSPPHLRRSLPLPPGLFPSQIPPPATPTLTPHATATFTQLYTPTPYWQHPHRNNGRWRQADDDRNTYCWQGNHERPPTMISFSRTTPETRSHDAAHGATSGSVADCHRVQGDAKPLTNVPHHACCATRRAPCPELHACRLMLRFRLR